MVASKKQKMGGGTRVFNLECLCVLHTDGKKPVCGSYQNANVKLHYEKKKLSTYQLESEVNQRKSQYDQTALSGLKKDPCWSLPRSDPHRTVRLLFPQ